MIKRRSFKYLLVLLTLVILLTGCKRQAINNNLLESEEYSDVIGIYHDVYVVNNEGLMSLYKDGKKVSKNYYSLRSLQFIDYYISDDTGHNWNYFLGQDKDLNFYIIDQNGTEKKLNEQYKSLNKIYDNILIFDTKDSKFAIYFLSRNVDIIVDSLRIINGYDKSEKLFVIERTKGDKQLTSLMNSNGIIVLENFLSYNELTVYTTGESTKYEIFYCFNTDKKSYLINSRGQSITTRGYDNIIRVDPSFIECSNNGEDEKVYVNGLGCSFVVDTRNYRVRDIKGNFLILENLNNSFKSIHIYDGKNLKVIDGLTDVATTQDGLALYIKDGKKEIIKQNGQVLYTFDESEDTYYDFKSSDNQNNYYVFYSPSKSQYIIIDDAGTIKRINVTEGKALRKSRFANIFLIRNNNNLNAIISFDDLPANTDNLIYYSHIEFFEDLIIAKENENNEILIFNNTGSIIDTINIDLSSEILSNTNLEIYQYSKEKKIIRVFSKIDGIRKNQKQYLVYKIGDNQYRHLEMNQKFSIMDEVIIVDIDSKSNIYKLNEETNQFELFAELDFEVIDFIVDDKEYYFIISVNNYVGLINSKNEVILNPQFESIKAIKSNHVVVNKEKHYGIIKLQEKNKYKIVMDIAYSNMDVFDDLIIITNHLGEQYCYNFFGKKVINDRVILIDKILHTTIDEESESGFKYKNTYKLSFGNYIRLLHSEE